MKFKVGDKVFHVGHGVGTVLSNDVAANNPLMVTFMDGYRLRFLYDGREEYYHTIPQLYTLPEARKMGFEVPKEKKTKTLWVYYNITSKNFMTCAEREPDQVGYLEKEVTFEWE